MITFSLSRILVAVDPVDFRQGIDGLVRLCKDALGQDPFRGGLFAFRNRRATALKVLVYDGQGFWLCHKRLPGSTQVLKRRCHRQTRQPRPWAATGLA
jgi:transposase